jgi:hypothetical protein
MYTIQIENGKHSFLHENTIEEHRFFSLMGGLRILVRLLVSKKITNKQFTQLHQELAPCQVPLIVPYDIDDKPVTITHIAESASAFNTARILAHIQIVSSNDYPEPKIEICKGCGQHAGIFYKEWVIPRFESQEEGFDLLEYLKDENKITLGQFYQLKAAIESSGLPVKKEPEKVFDPCNN